jgi:hypothetical protein
MEISEKPDTDTTPESHPDIVSPVQIIGNNIGLAKQLNYIHLRKEHSLPAYYFLEQPDDKQLEIAQSIAFNSVKNHLNLILEIGYGSSLSPLDTAISKKDTIVMAFDPNGKFFGNIKSGTENLKLPSEDSSSLAVFFKQDIRKLKKADFPSASQVHIIAPYPTMVKDMIMLGLELSNTVLLLPNPAQTEEGYFEKIVSELPKDLDGEVDYLNQRDLEQVLGTSKSSFIFITGNETTPLIKVQKNP